MNDDQLEQFKKEFDESLSKMTDEELLAEFPPQDHSSVVKSLVGEMCCFHQMTVAEAIIEWTKTPDCGKRALRELKKHFSS